MTEPGCRLPSERSGCAPPSDLSVSRPQTDGPSLMGVAGVDISMKEILRHAPWKKLGPFGYTFAINPNGIVVFHPYLREPLHYMEVSAVSRPRVLHCPTVTGPGQLYPALPCPALPSPDPQDPPDLDLTQLEGEAVVDLRRLMIRRNSDSVELERTVVPLPDGHRLELRRVQYFCRPIDNTTLRWGGSRDRDWHRGWLMFGLSGL